MGSVLGKCLWTWFKDYWLVGCGEMSDEIPEGSVKFCPFCGGQIEIV